MEELTLANFKSFQGVRSILKVVLIKIFKNKDEIITKKDNFQFKFEEPKYNKIRNLKFKSTLNLPTLKKGTSQARAISKKKRLKKNLNS